MNINVPLNQTVKFYKIYLHHQRTGRNRHMECENDDILLLFLKIWKITGRIRYMTKD